MIETSPFRPKSPLVSLARNAVRSLRRLRLQLRLKKRLRIDGQVFLGPKADFRPPGWIRIGNNVAIGKNCTVESNLTIGDEVLISSNVAFVGNDHAFDDPNSTVFRQGRLPDTEVILEGDNLIGFGAIVIGNVRIGKGCIVGAGAIVTKDLPPNMVCAGVPARPLRPRFRSLS